MWHLLAVLFVAFLIGAAKTMVFIYLYPAPIKKDRVRALYKRLKAFIKASLISLRSFHDNYVKIAKENED